MNNLADSLLEAITNFSLDNDAISHLAANLSNSSRWEIVGSLMNRKQLSACHFLHIPKTGGTTFGESLASDNKALVISVDSDSMTFIRHIKSVIHANPDHLVVTRAHHPYSLISNLVDNGTIKLVFSAYRDPVDLQVSNVNMIMRRMHKYLTGEGSLSKWESEFCKQWLARFERPYENTSDFARELLLSQSYIRYMGSIYSKFLNTKKALEGIRTGKIKMIDSTDFDGMFTDVFDYESTPPRRNVSSTSYIDKASLTVEERMTIIGSDNEIIDLIKENFVKPSDLKSSFMAR